MTDLNLQPNVAVSLGKWHEMIRTGNLSALPGLLDPQAVFRSPMAHTPYPGAPVVSMILNTVFEVFEDRADIYSNRLSCKAEGPADSPASLCASICLGMGTFGTR